MNVLKRIGLVLFIIVGLLFLYAFVAYGQNPQSSTAPIYATNSKYTNGVAPGYYPTQQALTNGSGGTIAAATGLHINIGPGTANCSGTMVTYNGGTLLMTASAVNNIYLNTGSSCAVAVKTSSFTSSDIPIATVTAGTSTLTTIIDDRTIFSVPGAGGTVVNSWNGRSGIVSLTAADVNALGAITNNTSGNAATATQLASAPTNCSSGNAPTGIDAAGNAQNCAPIGGGGGGWPPNPSNTVHYFLASSVLADDNHGTSVAVPVSTWTANGTIVDVHTSSNHNLTTSSWVDLTSMTGWFSGNPFGGQQDTTYGSFQVASVVSPTEFTVAYTRNTGSGSGGNIYDASYWAVYTTAQQPLFLNHGTMNYWWTPVQSAAANISTFLPTCTTTCFLDVESAQNDVFSGRTSGQIEGNFQTIWAAARAKGYKVIQGTIIPTNFGLSASNTMWETIQEVNLWIRLQGPSQANKATGFYWDQLVDIAPYYSDGLTDKTTLPGNGTTGSMTFAIQWNDAFGHQGGKLSTAPNAMPWESGLALSYPQNLFVLSNAPGSWGDAVIFDQTHDIWKFNQLYGNFGTSTPLFEYNWANALAGNHICNAWQINTTTNNSFSLCLGYAGSGSTSNYFGIAGGSGGTTDWLKVFANGAIQIPGVHATSGVEPLCIDTSGNIQHGTCGGAATWGSITGTLSAQTDLQTALNAKAPSASPTLTGVVDASGASQVKLPVAAGYSSAANGECGYDSTNGNWHCFINGADTIMLPLSSTFTSGHCGQPTLHGSTWIDDDAGGPCGVSGGGSAFSAITAGVNTNALVMGSAGSFDYSGTGTINANKLVGVPFCTGFTPTNGQNLQYTTASTPNPCYTAATPAGGGGATVGSINPNGYQTPVLVQSGTAFNNAGSGTITKAFTSNVTSGNLIHVYTYGNINGGNSISCTDSNSPTPIFIAGFQIGGAGNPQNNSFVWVVSASGPDTVSCTFTNYASNSAIEIEEWSGLTSTKDGTKSYGDFGYGGSNQFPFQSLGINTTTPNDMIFSTSANQANISGASFGGGASDWNYPYTTGWFPSTNYAVAIEYRVLPYAGTTSAIFNNNYGAGQSSYIFALKAKTTTAVSCTTNGALYVNTAATPKAQSFVCNGSGTWIPY